MHHELIGLLAEVLGSLHRVFQQEELADTSDPAPFLCFQRRSREDILLAVRAANSQSNSKVAGSAQRRWRGAVLQHGSVLLAASPFAPELRGIADLTGELLSANELGSKWASRLRDRLGLSTNPQTITADETGSTRRLVTEKFASTAWTNRR
jgi:lipoate-protein ligase A